MLGYFKIFFKDVMTSAMSYAVHQVMVAESCPDVRYDVVVPGYNSIDIYDDTVDHHRGPRNS